MGPHLSPNTLVVRLNDAGMADQMAEYVCHALIRHFREFAAYDKDMAQRQWNAREPLPRGQFPVGVMGLGALGERVARAVGVFGFPVRWLEPQCQADCGCGMLQRFGRLHALFARHPGAGQHAAADCRD